MKALRILLPVIIGALLQLPLVGQVFGIVLWVGSVACLLAAASYGFSVGIDFATQVVKENGGRHVDRAPTP